MKWLVLLLALSGCSVAHAEETDVAFNQSMASGNEGGGTVRTKTGWAQSGTLVTGNTVMGAKMAVHFGIHSNYTVQFNLKSIPVAGTLLRPMAKAAIDWSVAGNTIHREISVFDGATITGVAEAINVSVIDATSGFVIPAGRQYTCTITAARGVRGSNKQPPFFALPPVQISPGASTTITLPDDVGAVSLFQMMGDANAVPNIIPQGTVIGAIVSSISVVPTVFDATKYDWIPLPPGSQTLTYAVDAGLPFEVAISPFLGIDG